MQFLIFFFFVGRPLAPAGPANPTKPFVDILMSILMSIIELVWSIAEPIIVPLILVLFQVVGPLIITTLCESVMNVQVVYIA
jgi:hypothetical protein